MKKVIRYGVFESNSSSTHTLTIFTKKEWEEFKKGNLYIDKWSTTSELYTLEDIEKEAKKDAAEYNDEYNELYLEEYISDNGYCKEENLYDDLEVDITKYTSPSGDELVMVCRYGRNG